MKIVRFTSEKNGWETASVVLCRPEGPLSIRLATAASAVPDIVKAIYLPATGDTDEEDLFSCFPDEEQI